MDPIQVQQLYHVRQENLDLKKKVKEEQEKVKRLNTKTLRLTEDLKRQLSIPAKDVTRTIQNDDLLQDLKSQIRDLTKSNQHLKTKLLHYKAASEAAGPKKNLYGGIGPSSNLHGPRRVPINNFPKTSPRKLISGQALTNMLREKLEHVENTAEQTSKDLAFLQSVKNTEVESALLKADVERIGLQKELRQKNAQLDQLEASLKEAKSHMVELQRTNADAEELSSLLREEKRSRMAAEQKLLDGATLDTNLAELNEIIKDLRQEKDFLEKELARIMAVSLNSRSHAEQEKEMQSLKEKIRELQDECANVLEREKLLLEKIQSTDGAMLESEKSMHRERTKAMELQQKYDDLNEKMGFFIKEGIVDLSEIEEALAIVHMRKQKGVRASLDFLEEMDEHTGNQKSVEILRLEHVQTIRDLEKYQKLLGAQETINMEYKAEIALLQQKLDVVKNNYESRLEHAARQLDYSQNRCSRLEAKLSEIANGTVAFSLPEPLIGTTNPMDSIPLEKGQNVLEIHIRSAELNAAGIAYIREQLLASETPLFRKPGTSLQTSKSCDLIDPAQHLTTFATFDFFDFSTQVTPIALGLNPLFHFTARFTVTVDDFFLEYLSQKSMYVELWRSVGGEFAGIGASRISFRDLIGESYLESPSHDNALLQGISHVTEIEGKAGQKEPLGKLFYSIRTRLSMAESIRMYKERNMALDLLREDAAVESTEAPPMERISETIGAKDVETNITVASTSDLPENVVRQRYQQNQLTISLLRLDNLKLTKQVTGIFASFSFYKYGDFLTDTRQVLSSHFGKPISVTMNNQIKIPVSISGNFDRYMRTSLMEISVYGICSQNESIGRLDEEFVLLGKVNVAMEGLVRNEAIRGPQVFDDHSGSLVVNIQWEKPYMLVVNPIVSLVEATRSKEKESGMKEVSNPETVEKPRPFPMEKPAEERIVSEVQPASMDGVLSPPQDFSLVIESIIFEPDDDRVSAWLQQFVNIGQFFVSFDFMDLPSENLESPSLVLALRQQLAVQFQTDIPLVMMKQWLDEDADTTILFTVVSEPPESETNLRCTDFAVAPLRFREAMQLNGKKEEASLKLPLFPIVDQPELGISTDTVVGTLNICLRGIDKLLPRSASKVDLRGSAPLHPLSGSLRNLNGSRQQLPITGSFARLPPPQPSSTQALESTGVLGNEHALFATHRPVSPSDSIDEIVADVFQEDGNEL